MAGVSLRSTVWITAISLMILWGRFEARAGIKTVSPGQSIQSALETLSPGDTLMVRAGTYREGLTLPRSGSPGKPIVLMAYPGEKPVVESSDQVLSISKSYWIIDGFVFDHLDASSDAIKIGSGASFVTIRNCEIRNGKRDGFDISGGASDITIENNRIHDFVWKPGSDAHGIVTNPGATRIHILNNTIFNCGGDAIQLYASDSHAVSEYAREINIIGNTLYTTLGSNSENALDFKGVDGGLIENNIIYGFENKAVVVQKGCSNLIFRGNIIYDSQRGMEFRGEGGKIQRNHRIYKNVIYNIREYYAVKFDGVENVDFVNNTVAFINTRALRVEGAGVKKGRFQNNLFYQTGKPSIKSTFDVSLGYNGWFGVSPGSVAGPGDISGSDPGFVNAGAYDFRLTASSPAIDAGTDVGLPFRGAAPDLGAHEYGDPATSARILELRARVQENTVELRWRVSGERNISGYSVESSRDGATYESVGFIRARNEGSGETAYRFQRQNLAPGTYYFRLRQVYLNGKVFLTEPIKVLVGLPDGFLLEQNTPNPFSLSQAGETRISFYASAPTNATLKIYNILGQVVYTLFSKRLSAGRHVFSWNGRDLTGMPVAPGLYFYELQTESRNLIKRMMIVQ